MKLELGVKIDLWEMWRSFLWVLRLVNKRIYKQNEKEVARPLEFVRKTAQQVSCESGSCC